MPVFHSVSLSLTPFADLDLRTNALELDDQAPRSPPQTRAVVSPPPLKNRHLAGHTPLRGSICGPLSPALSVFSERLDTPTRSNTTLNETLTQDESQDRPLKGPLMMPELPNRPGEENFTMDMLEAKLRDLVDHPEESEPMVLKAPTPGLEEPHVELGNGDAPGAPDNTVLSHTEATESRVLSPSTSQKADSFDGSIKLRKKLSCNFGAPLGQMNPMWKH